MKSVKALYLTVLGLLILPVGLWAQADVDHYNAGYQAYQAGNWAKAVSELTTATQMNASYWEAYQLLSYASFKNGDVKGAIHAGETSLALYPHNPNLKGFVDRLKSNSMPAPPDMESPAQAQQGNQNPDVPPAIHDGKSDGKVNSIYLKLGMASPYDPSDFKDNWGTGPGLGLGYGIGMSRTFSVVLDMDYSSFPFTYTYPGLTTTGGGIHLLNFRANAKFNFTDRDNPVVFYGMAGVGPTVLTTDTFTASGPGGMGRAEGFSETDLSFRLGLGIDIRMGKDLYLIAESNGVGTFVSQQVTSQGSITTSLFSVGLRIDTP